MNELHVISIVYTGDGLNKTDVERIVEFIASKHNITSQVIQIFDNSTEDIVKLTVESLQRKDREMPLLEFVDITPEDEAVICIGTSLKEENDPNVYRPERFVEFLLSKIARAKVLPGSEDSKKFMNALFILSQEDLKISQHLLKKYHIDEKKLSIIKRIYHFISTQ